MWKPATRQITGTNDGTFHCLYVQFFGNLIFFYFPLVPLGQRRRFGPAPAEDGPAPQLAQPSPSAYPRSQHQDESPGKRGRDESPVNGDPKGKHETIICLTSMASLHRALFLRRHWRLYASSISILDTSDPMVFTNR